jgi:hypothetical protein
MDAQRAGIGAANISPHHGGMFLAVSMVEETKDRKYPETRREFRLAHEFDIPLCSLFYRSSGRIHNNLFCVSDQLDISRSRTIYAGCHYVLPYIVISLFTNLSLI